MRIIINLNWNKWNFSHTVGATTTTTTAKNEGKRNSCGIEGKIVTHSVIIFLPSFLSFLLLLYGAHIQRLISVAKSEKTRRINPLVLSLHSAPPSSIATKNRDFCFLVFTQAVDASTIWKLLVHTNRAFFRWVQG